MSFKPSIEKIRDIVERRLIRVDHEFKKSFPDVLKGPNAHWVSFGNDALLSLLFVTDEDMERISSFQTSNFEPFPGLFTTDPKAPAALRLDQTRFGFLQGNSVVNSISFSIGVDTTFIVINHSQSLETKELGKIAYTLPLGYFVSFGDDITPDNVYEHLDELIAYSVKKWRESHGG
jgi:hypothetical protein